MRQAEVMAYFMNNHRPEPVPEFLVVGRSHPEIADDARRTGTRPKPQDAPDGKLIDRRFDMPVFIS